MRRSGETRFSTPAASKPTPSLAQPKFIYSDTMTNSFPVDLVGVGLNATDTVIPLETYPARGSKTEYSTISTLPGGQVATTVVACQQWGLRTRYVGKLGDDLAATLHREAFSHAGVEAHIITAPGVPSAQSLILVDAHGERTVLCRRDERILLHPTDLRLEWITNAPRPPHRRPRHRSRHPGRRLGP